MAGYMTVSMQLINQDRNKNFSVSKSKQVINVIKFKGFHIMKIHLNNTDYMILLLI